MRNCLTIFLIDVNYIPLYHTESILITTLKAQ